MYNNRKYYMYMYNKQYRCLYMYMQPVWNIINQNQVQKINFMVALYCKCIKLMLHHREILHFLGKSLSKILLIKIFQYQILEQDSERQARNLASAKKWQQISPRFFNTCSNNNPQINRTMPSTNTTIHVQSKPFIRSPST